MAAKLTPVRIVMGLLVLLAAAGSFAFVALKPNRDITTKSDEAYAAYLQGMEAGKKIYIPEARAAFQKAADLDPDCAMAWVRLARLAYQGGDVEATRKLLDKAQTHLDRLKEKEKLFIRLQESDLKADEKANGEIIATMLAKFPDDTEILFMAGNRAFHRKEYEAALDSFHRLLERAPEMGEVYNMMGYALAELGRWNEAAEAFQKYTFIYPDQANPHDSLGELYLQIGRYDDAIVEFGKALALKPDFSWAYFHSGMALMETGRYDRGLGSMEKAIEVATSSDDKVMWRRHQSFFTMSAGHTKEAVRLAESLAREFPEKPVSSFTLGRAHAADGRPDLAAKDLDDMIALTAKYLKANPGMNDSASMDNFQINELRGEVAMARNDWALADSSLKRAMVGADGWWIERRLELERAECLVNLGRFADAATLTGEVLKTNPHEPSFHYWAGRALEGLGKKAEAREHYFAAAKTLGESDSGNDLLADLNRRLKPGA